jgi:aspartokinase
MIGLGAAQNNGTPSWSLEAAARVLHALSEAGLDIPMFSQSFSEHRLNLIVRQQDQAHCLSALERKLSLPLHLDMKEKVATISVVGLPHGGPNNIVSKTFAALGAHGTRVIAITQAASEHCVSICIPEDQVAETVQYLHQALDLE